MKSRSRSRSWLILGGLLLVAAIRRIRIHQPLAQTGQPPSATVKKNATNATTTTLLNHSVPHDNHTETMVQQPQLLQDLIDPTSPLVQCGKLKCFFPSRSNAFQEGYLIAQQGGREDLKQNISIWKRVFDETAILARQWEADYGLRHFLKGNYTTQSCTPELAAFLNQRANNNNTTKVYVPMENHNPKDDDDKNLLFVQPVWTAPPRHVIFGCKRPSRVQAARNALPHALMQGNHNRVDDNFVTTIRQELNATLFLMTKEPRLRKDFQILLDTNTGRIYHLDLDRCVRPMKLVSFQKCAAALRDFVELAIALVQEQQQANENATNSTNF